MSLFWFFDSPELESLNYHQFQDVVEIYGIAYSQRGDADWNTVRLFAEIMLQTDRAMMGIIEEIKAIANFEHHYNPHNASWGLILKQLLEGEKQ